MNYITLLISSLLFSMALWAQAPLGNIPGSGLESNSPGILTPESLETNAPLIPGVDTGTQMGIDSLIDPGTTTTLEPPIDDTTGAGTSFGTGTGTGATLPLGVDQEFEITP